MFTSNRYALRFDYFYTELKPPPYSEELKKNGVSERVIMAMMEAANPQLRQGQPARAAAPQTPTGVARTPEPATPRPQPTSTPPPYLASSSTYGEDEIERGIVFGGLAYSRGDLHANFLGWSAALSTALTDRLALKSDFSGVYTTVNNGLVDYSLYSFAVGPEFRARLETINFFAHSLVGLSRSGAALNFRNAGDNNLEFVFGGGLDFWLSPIFGIRPIQGDYQLIRAGGESVHMARLSAGALFRF
ncbi:MAG: hypothetical protein EHM61_10135 [Acidobacteria bacterium]|nr:MAG: hypothetical protein EHM61_10135 [Acidobacteriota bacterium]